MQHVPFGKTGMHLTRVGFGSIPIQRLDEAQAVKVIRFALDKGINWIDTAHSYGTSEERIGKAIRGYDRGRLFLFTKLNGNTLEQIQEQLELSLRRMNTDYIDFLQFHGITTERRQTLRECGALDYIRRQRDAGVVRHIGASFHLLESALDIMPDELIEGVQWPFNFIEHERAEQVLEVCDRRELGLIAMKPFGGGMLGSAGPCIRFLMQFPRVVMDPGFETIEEIEEVVRIAEAGGGLTDADRAYIDKTTRELGRRFCRRCGYCGPCPNDVNIVVLMTAESMIKRLAPEQLKGEWIRSALATADNCTRCGICETRCPYQLSIREQIHINAARLREAGAG